MRMNMRFVIVTGMSGAGKSSVLKMLEDIGYFCVDNLPVKLIPKLTKMFICETDSIEKLALGIDIRNLEGLSHLDKTLNEMRENGYPYEILFLDADSNVLVKRYKETRRNHPLALQGRVDKAIEAEREELQFIKKHADYIMDTSHMLVRELKQEIDKIFLENEEYQNFFITILSFGFKYGIPADCDLVFDVRFLPNPYYIPELKKKTGNDFEVYDYVMKSEQAKEFDEKVGVDGVILSKMDGDTRGGAALSVKAVTGKPILYVGMGEKLSDLEQFYPDRMASRILGMGDVLSLIEKAGAELDEEKAKKMADKMKKAQFDFEDYLDSMEQMRKMGGLSSIMGMLPGMGNLGGKMPDLDSEENEKKMAQMEAIIYSMTLEERRNPDLLNPSRKHRIAKGAGVDIADVNRMVKQFNESRKMMKKLPGMMGGKGGKRGKFKLPF